MEKGKNESNGNGKESNGKEPRIGLASECRVAMDSEGTHLNYLQRASAAADEWRLLPP